MSQDDRTILVFGATGQQGGGAARALLQDGWKVRAFVRSPTSSKAEALARAGATLVEGDFRDGASIRRAFEGAYGVFSVQPSSGQPEYGVTDADESAFGIAIADAALEAGVQHLIYTSVAGAAADSGVGHFLTKWAIEEHVRSLPFDWTILRPAAFMELLTSPAFLSPEGTLTFFQMPDRPMQFIAADDIGRIAAAAFSDRAGFRRRTLDIAGDSLTGDQAAAELTAARGRPFHYQRFPADVLDANPLLRRLVDLTDAGKTAGEADIPALRWLIPGLMSFDIWLKENPGVGNA